EDGPLPLGHRPGRVADVLVRAALDRFASDAEHAEQAAGVVQTHDYADTARHRRRVGVDAVAAHRPVEGAAGRHVHHAGDDRLAGLAAEAAQVLVHDVAGRHRAAGAVETQHHGLDVLVVRRGVEAFAEQRHGVVPAAAQQAAGTGV